MSNLNLSLTLVDVKLVNLYSEDDWNGMNVDLISISLNPELIWTGLVHENDIDKYSIFYLYGICRKSLQ